MNKGLIYIILFLFLILNSCAHKSGHNKRNRRSNVISQNHRTERDDKVEASKPTATMISNKKKLEGVEVFRKYNNAVFLVYTSDGSNVHQGSGFFIGPKGVAVSNYHVFQGTNVGDEAIKIVGSTTAYKVTEIFYRSEREDFIIFRVNYDNKTSIPIAKYKPSVGEKVFAIGSPRGLENTFSSGEVSQWRADNLMQISAQIDHGSSGGALLNEYGEVVGITSGTFADGSQANLNYAWSIDAVKPYLNIN